MQALVLRSVLPVLLALAGLLTIAVARGQDAPALPDTLAWERVGDFAADGLFVEADTVWAIENRNYFYRYVIGSGEWDDSLPRLRFISEDVHVSADGVVYVQGGALQRSPDRGQTWSEVLPDAFSLPFAAPAGTLLATNRGRGSTVARSTDSGLTWTLLDHDNGLGCTPLAFAAAPPTPDLPEGRIAVVGFCGFSYSDDDGRTWTQTALYENFRYYVPSVVRLSAGPHAGRLVAEVEDSGRIGGSGLVYGSDDGGASWVEVGQIPEAPQGGLKLVEVDGLLFAHDPAQASVVGSGDGGATWRDLGPVSRTPAAEVYDIEVDGTGRLWAATQPPLGRTSGGGVWRTTAPVVAVSAEEPPPQEEPPGKPGEEVSITAVYPNPGSQAVRIAVEVPRAQPVRLAVYDVLGRSVSVVHEGVLAAGGQAFTVETDGWPAGVYLVEAETEGQRATQRFTLVR